MTRSGSTLYAAKILRKIAPVCHLFAQRARTHPDNNTPQRVHPTVTVLQTLLERLATVAGTQNRGGQLS